ncbi:MAG: hypothetical protein J6X35_05495 [Bacteroidales bacterium]|nr:hypothetical protein [Bacteroidales bacterium]
MSVIKVILDRAYNAANAARQAAVTEASFAERSSGYRAGNPPLQVSYSDNDRLRLPKSENATTTPNDGIQMRGGTGMVDNEVAIATGDGKVEIRITDALIKVEQSKRIVTTQLVNRSGTVKEYVQMGDYVIKINGHLIGEQGKFPYDDLNNILIPLLERAENLKMASKYTEAFGINEVVLTESVFDQNQMKLFNVMPFELKFVSDSSYEFLVEE